MHAHASRPPSNWDHTVATRAARRNWTWAPSRKTRWAAAPDPSVWWLVRVDHRLRSHCPWHVVVPAWTRDSARAQCHARPGPPRWAATEWPLPVRYVAWTVSVPHICGASNSVCLAVYLQPLCCWRAEHKSSPKRRVATPRPIGGRAWVATIVWHASRWRSTWCDNVRQPRAVCPLWLAQSARVAVPSPVLRPCVDWPQAWRCCSPCCCWWHSCLKRAARHRRRHHHRCYHHWHWHSAWSQRWSCSRSCYCRWQYRIPANTTDPDRRRVRSRRSRRTEGFNCIITQSNLSTNHFRILFGLLKFGRGLGGLLFQTETLYSIGFGQNLYAATAMDTRKHLPYLYKYFAFPDLQRQMLLFQLVQLGLDKVLQTLLVLAARVAELGQKQIRV